MAEELDYKALVRQALSEGANTSGFSPLHKAALAEILAEEAAAAEKKQEE